MSEGGEQVRAADLERRVGELQQERTDASEAHAAAREAVARALIGSASAAEVTKRRRAQAEAASLIEGLDAAIEMAEEQVMRLRADEAATAEQSALEDELGEGVRIADALPKIADHLDTVIALVEDITPVASMRRNDMYVALGQAFRAAVHQSNAGKPATVRPRLEEMSGGWRRNVERRAKAMASGSEPTAVTGPLTYDTVTYATDRFEFSDAGDRNVARVSVPAGTLLPLPQAVAVAAVSAGVAKIVDASPGRCRLRFLRGHRTADGRHFSPFEEIVMSAEEAGRLPAGVAVPIRSLLVHEITALRREYPPIEARGPWKNLGAFGGSADTAQSAVKALGEDARPINGFAGIDNALDALEATVA